MRTITEDELEKWKHSFAKNGIVYKTDEEYYEAINNFTGFIELLIEIDKGRTDDTESTDTRQSYVFDNDGNKIML